MSGDITFGEVEETPPQRERRPDQNRRFAVAACQQPVDGELAIFVDLDALLDMEIHALSDTSVELGGVMLGGQFEDDQGQPFVVVTDNLRAAHYEATKGSFKFTHDTWQQISRERDEFPAELQMVGWYHTHPDWGVFLSGMDTFICDHFFNRPLDVALVIDPCRQDRGWFQWTAGRGSTTRRTGGFYIFTSRYRADELAQFVAQLEEQVPMRVTPGVSSASSGSSAPIVNIHEEKPGWIAAAVVGILGVQLCLIVFGLVLFLTGFGGLGGSRIAELEKRIREVETREAVVDAKSKAIDELIGGLKDGPKGASEALAKRDVDISHLRAEVEGVHKLTAQRDRLEVELKKKKDDLESAEDDKKKLDAKLESKAKELKTANDKLDTLSKEKGGGTDFASFVQNNQIILGISAAVIAIAGIAIAYMLNRPNDFPRKSNHFGKDGERGDSEPPTVIDDPSTIQPPMP